VPGNRSAGKRVNAITQNIDIMPSILDWFGIDIPGSVQGKSLKGIIEGSETAIRDIALFGMHGKAVNIFDGRYTYFRAPASAENEPCYNYCAMPTTSLKYLGRNCTDRIEMGRFLDYTDYPVFRIPKNENSEKRNLSWNPEDISSILESFVYDLEEDYGQQSPVKDSRIEGMLKTKLIRAMKEALAPNEQYQRLGLKKD
jgi:hypothetical protein